MFVYSFNENQYLAELTFVLYIQFDIYVIKIYNVKFFIYAIFSLIIKLLIILMNMKKLKMSLNCLNFMKKLVYLGDLLLKLTKIK